MSTQNNQVNKAGQQPETVLTAALMRDVQHYITDNKSSK